MQGTYGSCLVIPAGASFDRRDANSQLYANGYNFCRIDPSRKKCKVHLRRFDGNRTWLPDVQTVAGEPTGSFELQLPDVLTKPHHRYRPLTPQYRKSSHPTSIFENPHLIDYEHPESIGVIDATVLECNKGGVELCIYIHPFGKGIRRLVNNRHVLAHATSPSSPYKNIFSFHNGPLAFTEGKKNKPTWQLWLVSDASGGNAWKYEDSAAIEAGWHHFIIRWDHDKPLLELLLDGKTIITADDYLKFWPKRVLTSMTVGCWPNPWREHYIDTWIAQVKVLSNLFDRSHLEDSLHLCRGLKPPLHP
jgi:hypothetical protein